MKKYLEFLKHIIKRQLKNENTFQWFQEQNKLIEEKKSNSFEFDISFGIGKGHIG